MTGSRTGGGKVDDTAEIIAPRLSAQEDLGAAPASSAAAAIERALLVNMQRTEIFFVRHGQQDYSSGGRARPGKTDPPLTETGKQQARCVAARLANEPISHVYCSDLLRARETAGYIAASVLPGQESTVVPELREVRLFRDLPGDRPLVDILGKERLLQVADEFLRTRRFDAFPDTESSAELRDRAVTAVTGLVTRHRDESFVIVAHGGFINSFIAEVLGIQPDMFFFPAHASVTRMLFNNRWALYSANETSHLQNHQGSLVTF
jgi:probable phosphoglycerate mutase